MIDFLAPHRLFLLLLLPVLILAHLLYHRRRHLVVSSLLIWQKSTEHRRRTFTIRRLVNINLLLQSLALIAAVLALGQPEVIQAGRDVERPIVLLLDQSAGMAVREEDGSRFDRLQRNVSTLLNEVDHRREVVVIAFSAGPELIGRFRPGDRELRNVLSEMAPTEESSDVAAALALSRRLHPTGEIHIFTDGAWDDTAVAIDREYNYLHIVGSSKGNIGFVQASVTGTGRELTFFALIGSYGLPPTPVAVTLYSDESIVKEEFLILQSDTTTELLFTIPGIAGEADGVGEQFVLELSAPGDDDLETDNLEADNRAYLIPAQRRPVRIARIGGENPFLESVLAVYPESDVDRFVRYSPTIVADILVLDGVRSVALPEGRVLALDSTIAGVHPATVEYLSEGTILETAPDHPIVRGFDLSTAFFERVFTVPPRDGLRPLLYHNDDYAGFTLQTERLKVVSLNVDTTRTNLVLQNAFPLLIHGALAWLSGDIARLGTLRTGEIVHLDTMPGDTVSVTNPVGETWSGTAAGTSTEYDETGYAGFYAVIQNDRATTVAVNLFSRDETNTTPRVHAPDVTENAQTGRPFWRTLTMVAIILLIADTVLWSRKR